MAINDEQKRIMQKVVELMLTTKWGYAQIAKEVGVTPQTISNWNGRGEFKEIREQMVRDAFQQYAPQALMTIVDLMSNSKADGVRLNAATQILDRGGFVMVEKVDFGGAVQFIEDVPSKDE